MWGDHVFVTTVINSGQAEAPKPGLYFGGERPRVDRAAPVDGARRRFRDRQGALVEGSAQRRARRAEASQEQLRVGDAGHRRRARLRLLRQRRPLRVRHEGHAGLVEAARPVQDAQRLGHRRVARAPPRSDLHRQRQRRPVVPGGVRQADGRRGLARESRGGHQLGDAVRVGARRPRGDRHVRLRQGALLRPDGQAAVGVQGDVEHQHPDAVRAPRPAVHLLRLRRRPAAPGVRDPARRDRATSR